MLFIVRPRSLAPSTTSITGISERTKKPPPKKEKQQPTMTAPARRPPSPPPTDFFCIDPGYQLQYTIPSPTFILTSTSRDYIEQTLDSIDAERHFLETGLCALGRDNYVLLMDLGRHHEARASRDETLAKWYGSRRKWMRGYMGDMELERLKNVVIRMVRGNWELVAEQHRLRDENQAMRVEVLSQGGSGSAVGGRETRTLGGGVGGGRGGGGGGGW
ncbi:MAG: hypothetical protein LQ350_000512 [Teloschistes chrysophthalmus]|nr:MAG: hypothetical protein LQ350_000512 [Niorma chrysophthalma]